MAPASSVPSSPSITPAGTLVANLTAAVSRSLQLMDEYRVARAELDEAASWRRTTQLGLRLDCVSQAALEHAQAALENAKAAYGAAVAALGEHYAVAGEAGTNLVRLYLDAIEQLAEAMRRQLRHDVLSGHVAYAEDVAAEIQADIDRLTRTVHSLNDQLGAAYLKAYRATAKVAKL